jgi:ribonuclease P protein component
MPTFSKQERLKSRKIISQLFKEGNSLVAYPLRAVWLSTKGEKAREGENVRKEEFAAQIAISVPKKNFKTAVVRNRIKRRIREAYRLHKEELYEKIGERPIALMLIFIAKEELPFAEIEAGVKKMIRKFPAE